MDEIRFKDKCKAEAVGRTKEVDARTGYQLRGLISHDIHHQ